MFLATANKPKQLLYLHFIQNVSAEELEQSRGEIEELLAGLNSGFRLVTDLCGLAKIDANCAAEIGRLMELFDQKGIEMVVRVVPDPAKDFGFNILSRFHYHHPHSTVTVETLAEAAHILELA